MAVAAPAGPLSRGVRGTGLTSGGPAADFDSPSGASPGLRQIKWRACRPPNCIGVDLRPGCSLAWAPDCRSWVSDVAFAVCSSSWRWAPVWCGLARRMPPDRGARTRVSRRFMGGRFRPARPRWPARCPTATPSPLAPRLTRPPMMAAGFAARAIVSNARPCRLHRRPRSASRRCPIPWLPKRLTVPGAAPHPRRRRPSPDPTAGPLRPPLPTLPFARIRAGRAAPCAPTDRISS